MPRNLDRPGAPEKASPIAPARAGRRAWLHAAARVVTAASWVLAGSLAPRDAGASWVQRSFVVGGYGAVGDPASLVRLDAAGLDYVIPFDWAAPRRALELAARLDSLRAHRPGFHLQEFAYLETGASGTLFKSRDPAADRAAILRALSPATGLNNPSVAGWYVWDEPPLYYPPTRTLTAAQAFGSIHELTRIVRESAPGVGAADKLALVCLLPVQAGRALGSPCDSDEATAYRCYLESYLSAFDHDPAPAPVLMFDDYPFETPAAPARRYPEQLALVRDAAARYARPGHGIPFWSVIQVSPRRERADAPYRREPTFAQIRWQAWVSVAYGARGVFYWALRPTQGDPSGPGFGAGLLEADGSPNPALYDSLAGLDRDLHAAGPVLMTLTPVAVLCTPEVGSPGPSQDDSLLRATRGFEILTPPGVGTPAVIVGYFRSAGGGEYALVVNADTRRAKSIAVGFRGPPCDIYRVATPAGGRIAVAARATRFETGDLPPGGGALFELAPPGPR